MRPTAATHPPYSSDFPPAAWTHCVTAALIASTVDSVGLPSCT